MKLDFSLELLCSAGKWSKLVVSMSTAVVPAPSRSTSTFWIGLLVTLLGVASNLLYWLPIPPGIIPWINLALPLIGLVLVIVGLLRLWPGSRAWRKILGCFVGLISAAVLVLSVWGHLHAREVPPSPGAPRMGQKVPDFTLQDSSGRPVSLSQLLTTPLANSTPPKAVLLVFYRGYW